MPSLEQPSGHAAKKELSPEVSESAEVSALKTRIKIAEEALNDMEKEAAGTEDEKLKKTLEKRVASAEKNLIKLQEHLAGKLSSKFAEYHAIEAPEKLEKEQSLEYLAQAGQEHAKEWSGAKAEVLEEKKEKGKKLESQIDFLKTKLNKEKEAGNQIERKKLQLQLEALEEELESLTPDKTRKKKIVLRKPEEGIFEKNEIEEHLKKVREKIAGKPEEEIFLSNWPTGEKAKEPKEKPFTKTEEAWFAEGEKAGESREAAEKLEQTAKKRSSAGLSPKVSAEEPQAVKDARNNLDDAKKKLDDMGIDPDIVTGSWINRTQIKLQSRAGFFSKKAKEIDKLCDTYLKAKKEVEEMTRPTGDASKQRLRGLAASGRKTPPGGPWSRPE